MQTKLLWTKEQLIKRKEPQESSDLVTLLRRANRAATRIGRERASELDLTYRRAAAVRAIVDQPGATLSVIAEALGADQPTASTIVDHLIDAGFVVRETDPADRRRAMLQPTAQALALARRLADAQHASEERIRLALGAEDSAELARLLSRLIAALPPAGDEAEPRRD